MTIDTYLVGELATHRRGSVIADVFPVKPLSDIESLPDSGSLVMFGQNWQKLTSEQQDGFRNWLALPGRQLLLIPPFNDGLISANLDWLVQLQSESRMGVGLAANLCDEVKYGFEAITCQFERTLGHSWQDDSLNTLFFKQHATSGQFAVTSLPLWSLTCLDEVATVNEWFEALFNFAGIAKVSEQDSASEKEQLILQDAHHVLLCCAYGKSFELGTQLIERVKRLALFTVNDESLINALTDIETHQLFANGSLSQLGEDTLMTSPYKLYADELKRMTP